MLELSLDTTTPAFAAECRGPEIARILRNLAAEIEQGGAWNDGAGWILQDADGLRAGTCIISALPEKD